MFILAQMEANSAGLFLLLNVITNTSYGLLCGLIASLRGARTNSDWSSKGSCKDPEMGFLRN